jgi:hypothetical protein
VHLLVHYTTTFINLYNLIKQSSMIGSIVHHSKLYIFQPEYHSGIYIPCWKLTSLRRQICVARNYRLEGKRIVKWINNHASVITCLTHLVKPHTRSTQQASLRDHGITHQVSRINGCMFRENQVLILPLQPAVPKKMRWANITLWEDGGD